jgi:hypothetical protein
MHKTKGATVSHDDEKMTLYEFEGTRMFRERSRRAQ